MILICKYNDYIVSTGQYSKLTVIRYLYSIQCQSLKHYYWGSLEPHLAWMWIFRIKASFFPDVIYPMSCLFFIGATITKIGMAVILNFKCKQKSIIKILAFRSRRITIFMFKLIFFGSVNANVPLKMTPDNFDHTKTKA